MHNIFKFFIFFFFSPSHTSNIQNYSNYHKDPKNLDTLNFVNYHKTNGFKRCKPVGKQCSSDLIAAVAVWLSALLALVQTSLSDNLGSQWYSNCLFTCIL